MITVPPPPPPGGPPSAPSLVHIGDYAFNAACVVQVKRKKDKVVVYLVGGSWKTFKGDEAEAVWKWLTEVGTKVSPPRRL